MVGNRTVLIAVALLLTAPSVQAAYRFSAPGGQTLLLTGYLREHMAVNLEDHPEVDASGTGRLNGAGEISMLRSTFRLEAKADVGWAQFVSVYRLDREQETKYLDDINDVLGPGHNWMDDVEGDQMREWYGVFDLGPRVRATLGKQQVVWGETDFFRAMDIIHGFDLRWRSFLETENEELRKPLILANVEFDIPELNGVLQLVYRPGWDKAKELGNSIDLSGGRWAGQSNKGVDFLTVLSYNFNHSGADTDDQNYGFRWTGDAYGWNYSLNYWRGLNPDPIINPGAVLTGELPLIFGPGVGATSFNGLAANPFLGDIIFPKIETFGATATGYVEPIDSVIRVEMAFTPDKPYNFGTNFDALGGSATPFRFYVPGNAGVVEKNTLVSMIGIDKQMKSWNKVLGTSQFPLLSIQVFDTWLTNFRESDDIVEVFGYGASRKEHTTYLTGLVQLNYRNSRVNPSFAGVFDATNSDLFLIPALDLVFGDHWRIHTDLDLALPKRQKNVKRPFGPGGPLFNEDSFAATAEDDTHLFGTLANNSQFNFRLSYQF